MTVGIIVNDPSKLWFRYRDVSAVKRDGRVVNIYLNSQQIVTITTPSDAGAAQMMREIVQALEKDGQP